MEKTKFSIIYFSLNYLLENDSLFVYYFNLFLELQFYPEKIKYKKHQKAFLKENLKGHHYILDKEFFLVTYSEEIQYFCRSIFFNEYRLLNLLSQSFSQQNIRENEQKNQSDESISYNDSKDIRDIGIFESYDKLDQHEDITLFRKIVENRWFGNIRTEKEIHYLVSDFVESLPDDTAKPLYFFWVLSQRFIRRSSLSENQDESIEKEDLDKEKEIAIFKDIIFLNEWSLKSVRMNELLNEVVVEKRKFHKNSARHWTVSELENINIKIFKWLVSYWLPRHELITTTFKKYPLLLKDPMSLLAGASKNIVLSFNHSVLDEFDPENTKKILQTPLQHFHADEFPILKYLRLTFKEETLVRFYFKDIRIGVSEKETFGEKMTFIKKFLFMDYLNGASLKTSLNKLKNSRYDFMSSTSKMTEALEDHLSCVFAARRSRLEETFCKSGKVYEPTNGGKETMKDQRNNFKLFVIQLKKFEEFLKIHDSVIHFEFFRNLQKCLNLALNNQQPNDIEGETQYIFNRFINKEYFLSEKGPVRNEDLKNLPGYNVGFDVRSMTNMKKHLFIKEVYELLYTKLNLLYEAMSRHSKHTKSITNRVDNTMHQREITDNTSSNAINHSYRREINETSIEKYNHGNYGDKDCIQNFVLNNNLSGRTNTYSDGLQNSENSRNFKSKKNDFLNGVENYNKREAKRGCGDDGSSADGNVGGGGVGEDDGDEHKNGGERNHGGEEYGHNVDNSSWSGDYEEEIRDKKGASDKNERVKKENNEDGESHAEINGNIMQIPNDKKKKNIVIKGHNNENNNINNNKSNIINNNTDMNNSITNNINDKTNMNNKNIINNKNGMKSENNMNKSSNMKESNNINKNNSTNNNSNVTNEEEDGYDWLEMKKDFGLKRKKPSQNISDKKQTVFANRESEIKFKEFLVNKKYFKEYCCFAKLKSEDLYINSLFLKEVNIYKEMHSNKVNTSVLKSKISAIANKFFDVKDKNSARVSIDADTIWKTMSKKRELNDEFFKDAEKEVMVELAKHFEEFEAVKDDLIDIEDNVKYSGITSVKSFKGKARDKNIPETAENQGLKIDYENLIKEEKTKKKILRENAKKKLPPSTKNSKSKETLDEVRGQADETLGNKISWCYSDYLKAYRCIKTSINKKKIVV